MEKKSREREIQLSFLAPDEAQKEAIRRELMKSVEENLALVREIAALYNLPRIRKKRRQVRSPSDVAELLAPEMSILEQEQLRVVILNTKNEVISIELVYQGNLNTTVVRVGELFRDAVRRNAAGMILAHNHPSGSLEPSPEDRDLTRLAVKAGELLGIDVLDHLIIGQGTEYRSLKETCGVLWK